MQGQFGISNLSVTVCDCSLTPNCRNHKDAEIQAASGAIGIIFASLFLLLCKKPNNDSLMNLRIYSTLQLRHYTPH